MNIFILDKDPVKAAQMQCDKHVVKMILETAQLLCSPYPSGIAPYKRTHYNHPCSIWVREAKDNYIWLYEHGKALLDEYTFRYGKHHKSAAVIDWCFNNMSQLNLPKGFTEFKVCMPDELKKSCPVESYRNYYNISKASLAKWNNGRNKPTWFTS